MCVLTILAAPVLAQGGVSVTAEVDRTTISTDGLLTLTLTVAGDFQQLGEPQLPLMSGFNVVSSSRSSQFSMLNGVVTARTVFTYRLQPTGPGAFTIESVTVLVNGSPYQTEPIAIQVVQGAAPTQTPPRPSAEQTPSASAPDELADQDVYTAADVDNSRPVVGQQIIYRFRFYQAVNLLNQPRLDWPSFSSFWTEDLTPNNTYEQIVAGRLYRVTEVRRALFPTAAGQITIEPSKLISPDFGREGVLQTEPVALDVQPLPEGAPPDFAGAVGQFEIETWVEPTAARVNEPVTLFIRVSGAGNLITLPDPTEEIETRLPDWRVYDPQTTTNVGQEGDTIRGDKLFARLLVPKTAGELSIPSFALAYFDPQAGEYRRIKTEAVLVQVAPGEDLTPGPTPNEKQDVTLLASDIRHIKAAPPALATRRTPLLEQPVYWLGWFVPLLIVVGTYAWDRRRRRLSSDAARIAVRAQRARRRAHKRLARARKLAREDEHAVYAAVARALTDYCGDKFNLSAAGLTRNVIRHALTNQAVPDDLIDRALACLDWADSGRFAPVAAGRSAGELISEAQIIITELEQIIKGDA